MTIHIKHEIYLYYQSVLFFFFFHYYCCQCIFLTNIRVAKWWYILLFFYFMVSLNHSFIFLFIFSFLLFDIWWLRFQEKITPSINLALKSTTSDVYTWKTNCTGKKEGIFTCKITAELSIHEFLWQDESTSSHPKYHNITIP